MTYHFIFCHGFGFNVDFWKPLSFYFRKRACSFIDLGYFSCKTQPPLIKQEKIILVGHSLGLPKLLRAYPNPSAIIGLSCFVNFLGQNPLIRKKRTKELEILTENFKKNPIQTMKNFYIRAQAEKYATSLPFFSMHTENLLHDLFLLHDHIALPAVPTLICTTKEDLVVPEDVVADNFLHLSQVRWIKIEGRSHILGLEKTHIIYKEIKNFLRNAKDIEIE